MLPLFRESLWGSWSHIRTARIDAVPIPVNNAQLVARISADPFDGGRTLTWMGSLRQPTAVAVRDAATGHTIHVISDRRLEDLEHDLLMALRLMRWLTKRSITWYWWDHPWRRTVPARVDPGRDHVNGGWAVPGVLEVHVYRREEAHKVLLHECIHALRLDVASHLATAARNQFEAALGRRLWPHLGEAYTELYAEWLWSIASAASLRNAEAAWAYQLACSEKQAAQVWARIHDATEAEDTNVFAYYVLKWVLMQHLDGVLFQKNASVHHWFRWWQKAKPILDQKAKGVATSTEMELPMGMTCEMI